MTNPTPSPDVNPLSRPSLQRTVPRVPPILPIGHVGNREQIAYNWWAVLLRGVVGVIFGALAFFEPQFALTTAIFVFGGFVLIDGILLFIAGVRTREETENWWLVALQGLLGIIIGIASFLAPETTAVALLYYVAVWAIITGVLEISAAYEIRKEIEGEWMLALAGLASIILGAAMIFNPGAGLLVWLWYIGLYAFISGAFLIGLSFKLKSVNVKTLQEQRAEMEGGA